MVISKDLKSEFPDAKVILEDGNPVVRMGNTVYREFIEFDEELNSWRIWLWGSWYTFNDENIRQCLLNDAYGYRECTGECETNCPYQNEAETKGLRSLKAWEMLLTEMSDLVNSDEPKCLTFRLAQDLCLKYYNWINS